ncbi:MAG: helix-turn-helix transcriptional regulator [Flavobacteriaceae bacterium]|nr:helix-turn-helix transcriptional regulator [Flavobacteriaceae bacterium]
MKISDYIENNIHDMFSLDELSKMANINKFGLVKKFKEPTGMTPMNYILMRRIFSSKKLINSFSELTEIAYQYNVTDMAHFSKTFKCFIGISPKKYKKALLKQYNYQYYTS